MAENGLCNRVSGSQPQPRRDGWDRVRFLRANLAAVVQSIEAGVPVTGYFHWTLADSYEWGSYQPRYGLYGVERRSATRSACGTPTGSAVTPPAPTAASPTACGPATWTCCAGRSG